MRKRNRILLALLGLLVLATSAHAECAWVLWDEVSTLTTSSNPTQTIWHIGAAVPLHEACQSLMRREIQTRAAKLRETGDATVEGDTLIASGRDFTAVHRYTCLPDTVDPRGPKGK